MAAALVLLILLRLPGTATAAVPMPLLPATAAWNSNGSSSGAPNTAPSTWNRSCSSFKNFLFESELLKKTFNFLALQLPAISNSPLFYIFYVTSPENKK